MASVDRNYLRLQFLNRIYKKSGSEFQSFFEDIMQMAFPGFQKIRPYGKKGDFGNDGYRPEEGIYYQVYSPRNPKEKEAEAAKKLKEDFEKLKSGWDHISNIKEYHFVFNDKGDGVSIEIEQALATLRKSNPNIAFTKLTPRELEGIFFTLNSDQHLALGFDVDSTKGIKIARELLGNIEDELERENGISAFKALQQIKNIIEGLSDEVLSLDYEILECRALQKLEKVKKAKAKYENICIRYPNEPRAFLYLAEIQLNNENFEKNEELLIKAEKIDKSFWLLRLQMLFKQFRLGDNVDLASIDTASFPAALKAKSKFYRMYSLFFQQAENYASAESLIERAIDLDPDCFNNYSAKLSIIEGRMLSHAGDKEKFYQGANELLGYIVEVEEKAREWGGLSQRNQAVLNYGKIQVFKIKNNIAEVGKLSQKTFEIILKCYFDLFVDNLLAYLLSFIDIPQADFDKLLDYLATSEKPISDKLAKMIVPQFKQNLTTNGKDFFRAVNNQDVLGFIDSLERRDYDVAWSFLKKDTQFAVAIARTAKDHPQLRKIIIENLPSDGTIEKEKLRLLLSYDEKNIDEAFELLKGFDLSALNYLECKPLLEIAKEKQAWEFVVIILEKLLEHETDRTVSLQLKLQLFTAHLNLMQLPLAIQIGKQVLSDSDEMHLLDSQNKETLLAQTLLAQLKRDEYQEARKLLEKHDISSKSYEFMIGVEAEVYLKNNDAVNALNAIVSGIKSIKTPTPEQYGALLMLFTRIGNMIDFPLTEMEKIEKNCFVKLANQDIWYFIGDGEELDATEISSNNMRYASFINKSIGHIIICDDRYSQSKSEHQIEHILSCKQYICWQCHDHVDKLTREHRWEDVRRIDVPTKGEKIDLTYMKAFLEDERGKRSEFYDLYCKDNLPLALLAINEGGITNAIALIQNEKKGFINFSSGELTEINQQKEVAKRIISGESFYIDGTSALLLSETDLLKEIYEYLPNVKVPQSVITLLFQTKDKFRYEPGQVGHMGYAQGEITYSPVKRTTGDNICNKFEMCIELLESKPENVIAISNANKADCFLEQEVPADLCDACILAQKKNVPVLTEDYLYLKANEIQTKKKAPEYCSTFALMRVLYEQKKITFDQYLDYFGFLTSYRFKFLPVTIEDIEKAVFGDGAITTLSPEKIRQFNFSLIFSEEYGVTFKMAFQVIILFLVRMLVDDTVSPETVDKIILEILSAFPTKKNKRELGRMFLGVCVMVIKKNRPKLNLGRKTQEKIDSLSQLIEFYTPNTVFL